MHGPGRKKRENYFSLGQLNMTKVHCTVHLRLSDKSYVFLHNKKHTSYRGNVMHCIMATSEVDTCAVLDVANLQPTSAVHCGDCICTAHVPCPQCRCLPWSGEALQATQLVLLLCQTLGVLLDDSTTYRFCCFRCYI